MPREGSKPGGSIELSTRVSGCSQDDRPCASTVEKRTPCKTGSSLPPPLEPRPFLFHRWVFEGFLPSLKLSRPQRLNSFTSRTAAGGVFKISPWVLPLGGSECVQSAAVLAARDREQGHGCLPRRPECDPSHIDTDRSEAASARTTSPGTSWCGQISLK